MILVALKLCLHIAVWTVSVDRALYTVISIPDDDLNVWFWAMVGTGIVFIIFVITSVYLVW